MSTSSSKADKTESFPPLLGTRAHTLILGTMPGQQSLKAREYYAHPRNAFWPIMLAIMANSKPSYESATALPYAHRCQSLTSHGFAVWDVLASCRRPGSLDSNIARDSEQPNAIADLLTRYPDLSCIGCNGRTAMKLFVRHIVPHLDQTLLQSIKLVDLPSSSPAMASLTLLQKHERWATALEQL